MQQNTPNSRHRSRRRTLAASVLTAALLTTVAACGGGDGEDSGDSGGGEAMAQDDVLTITTFGDFGYADVIEKWNADENRAFTVKETKVSEWDTWKQTLTTNMQAGTGLTDIVAIEGDAMPQFLAEGAVDQFVDLSDDAVTDRWVEYAATAGQTADGKQIGYPTDTGPMAICYRGDLLEKAGLPSDREEVGALFPDWDAYFAEGDKFVEKMPDTKWYDSTGSIAQAMLNQTEYPFQDAENVINVDQAADTGLKDVYDDVTSHVDTQSTKVTQWSEDWQANFTNDGFATMPCPGWMQSYIKNSAPEVKGWDMTDAFPGGGGNWGGSFLAVPAMSEHPDEAKQFAQYLTDAEQQISANEVAGAYPANQEAQQSLADEGATDEYFNDAPTNEILANRAKDVKPDTPYKGDKYSDVLGLFQTALTRVDEGTDPEESWDTFVGEVEKLK